MSQSEIILGIDLGTTNTCAAIVRDGQPVVVPNRQGYRTTPSMFAIGSSGQPLVGAMAKRQQLTNPENTVYAVKRLIGRRWDSPEVARALKLYPFKLIEGPHEDVRVVVGGRDYAVPEISAKVLAEVKADVEAWIGQQISKAVITVPAFFNDNQRQATKDAGRIAGLDVLRIINEPTSAAIAYGLQRREDATVVVYDLGGGTFDVSILSLRQNTFEVLATSGDTFLGGEDIDLRILEELLTRFHARTGINLGGERLAMQRLKTGAEEAKIALSFEPQAVVSLPFIAMGADGNPIHFEETITRSEFEDWVRPLIARTMEITEKSLRIAGIRAGDVDSILLVGGQTRMPMIHRRLEEFFGKPARKGINPDEVVALGAAIHAAALTETSTDLLLMDVTPLSLGIATQGGGFAKLIERNTPVPCKRSQIFTTVRDNQDRVQIAVYQGEGETVGENEMLGQFSLTGIAPARRGEPKIEVFFAINSEGIVSVSARDLTTGRTQAIEVTASSGLTEEEIRRMRDDLEGFAVNPL